MTNATSSCKKSWENVVCSAYLEDNMVFNKSLPPPPLLKLYQIQNDIQTNNHQLCKGEGGGAVSSTLHWFDLCYAFAFIRKEHFFKVF